MPSSHKKPLDPDALLLESLLAPPVTLRGTLERHPRESMDNVLVRATRALPRLESAVKEPDKLLSDLLKLSRGRTADALETQPAFLRPIFLRYVRQTAIAALPMQPDLAEHLAFLAVQQSEASFDVEEARRHLVAAYCILAAVERLGGRPAKAEILLNRAALLVDSSEDQAFFLRGLAVLRWEQGRHEETQALLSRAALLKRSPEAAIVQLLLALLHVVEGLTIPRPGAFLRSAVKAIDPAHEPFPALLARLGLAYVEAHAGDLATASADRQLAQALFPLITDNKAAAYAAWIDARVSILTAPEGGLERFQFVRQELLQQGLSLTATLATVDAVLFLSSSRQYGLIASFLADAPLPLDLPPATRLCEALATPSKGTSWHQVHLRRQVTRLPSLLRRLCLLRGIPVEPLPFV